MKPDVISNVNLFDIYNLVDKLTQVVGEVAKF